MTSPLEGTMETLRGFLRAVLTSRGVEINKAGKWKCFVHDDKDPSANFVPGTNETRWYCHGCSAGGDAIDAIHHLDGKATAGPGWVQTVKDLCDEFNVPFPELQDLTPEQQRESDIYRAYDKAAQLILSMKKSDLVEAKLASYAWSKKTVRALGVGGVTTCEKFLKAMEKMGFTRDFLAGIGLNDDRIFSPECLIFTLKDQLGRPVGFTGRWLLYEKHKQDMEAAIGEHGEESKEVRDLKKRGQNKYINTGSKNPLFKKKELLYGFHAARQSNSRSLYIFEGNPDGTTAYNEGLINSCALCGSAFSKEHLKLILDSGFNHMIYVMDPDPGGLESTRRFAQMCREELASKPGIRANIIDLPPGDEKVDPDLFIRRNGLARFSRLPLISYIAWAWKDAMDATDKLTIVNEPSAPLRYELMIQLAQITVGALYWVLLPGG
jgi:DNA primase